MPARSTRPAARSRIRRRRVHRSNRPAAQSARPPRSSAAARRAARRQEPPGAASRPASGTARRGEPPGVRNRPARRAARRQEPPGAASRSAALLGGAGAFHPPRGSIAHPAPTRAPFEPPGGAIRAATAQFSRCAAADVPAVRGHTRRPSARIRSPAGGSILGRRPAHRAAHRAPPRLAAPVAHAAQAGPDHARGDRPGPCALPQGDAAARPRLPRRGGLRLGDARRSSCATGSRWPARRRSRSPASFVLRDVLGESVIIVRGRDGVDPRLLQRVPPPRYRGGGARVRQGRALPVPVPRVDLRPRRATRPRQAHRGSRGLQLRHLRADADPVRDMGRLRLPLLRRRGT